MGKAARRRATDGPERISPPAPDRPGTSSADRAGPSERPRWGLVAASCGLVLAFLWCTLCLRAARHYSSGTELVAAGNIAGAVREFESGSGCYAPLNPYCRASAEKMLALARLEEARDPALAREIRDRLRRSLLSLRGLAQPHGDILLAASENEAPAEAPRDPRGSLFLLSLVALAAGFGAWWTPLPTGRRAAVSAAGMAAWGLLLYLC